MKCPACQSTLVEVVVEKIKVNSCASGCGGIWFDKKEIEAFDTLAKIHGTETIRSHAAGNKASAPSTEPRNCPRCVKYKMQKRFSCVSRKVQIDECSGCGGIWLDPGELIEIQSTYSDDHHRQKAIDQFFDRDVTPLFEMERVKVVEKHGWIDKADKVFKFLRLSYYVKGS